MLAVQMLGSRPQTQKTVHGTITKLFENFGYVNEEIFFMRSAVTGGPPRVGDRVSVTADHTPGQPSKWTAQSVRIESRNKGPIGSVGSGSGSQTAKRSGGGGSSSQRPPPPQQPAYAVSVPHRILGLAELSVMELRQRYPRLHPPSDLFHVSNGWTAAFPAGSPLPLGVRETAFHVFPRDVDPLPSVFAGDCSFDGAVLPPPAEDPTDQDYRYTAKVMLLSSPALADLYRQTCSVAQEPAETRERCTSLSKTLRFLCGYVGSGGSSVDSKSTVNEPLALGGPWSPSADGEDVEGDPMVLVNTVVRHARRLAGIDLSACTTWYKFMELHYYREPRQSDRHTPPAGAAAASTEARMETVVYFLPDLWAAVPDGDQWVRIGEMIAQRVDALIYPPPPPPPSPPPSAAAAEADETAGDEAAVAAEEAAKPSDAEEDAGTAAAGAAAEAPAGDSGGSKLPDLQAMKVADLRRELESRGKDSRGLKAALVARLEEVLRAESEAEAANTSRSESAAEAAPSAVEAAKSESKPEEIIEQPKPREPALSERDQEKVRRSHRLPDQPAILAWPSRTAKGGRLRLEATSLSQLLANRQESGAKESAFEVALFCEQFYEMLTRDCAFALCTALAALEHPAGSSDAAAEDAASDDGSPSDDDGTNDDDDQRQPRRKRRRLSGAQGAAAAESASATAATGLTRTVRPGLLMACEFFDRERTGQLAARDVEELILTLGLLHSRSQIRRWVDKAADSSSNSFLRYRRLTDRPVTAAAAAAGYTLDEVAAEVEPPAASVAAVVFDRAGGCPPAPADGGCVELLALRAAEATAAVAAGRERLCRAEAPLLAAAEAEAGARRQEAEAEIAELKQRAEALSNEEAEHRRGYADFRRLLRDALANVDAARRPFVELFEAERREAEEKQRRREAEAAEAAAAAAKAKAEAEAEAAAAAAEAAAAAKAAADEARNEEDSSQADGAEGEEEADAEMHEEEDASKEWSVVDAV